ncbi:hypothetical protein F4604DRAFT_1674827 [Suillus subluteus]|nr:hypothetical protein F4604DRAFT_1674827 [Suillus subluteus]
MTTQRPPRGSRARGNVTRGLDGTSNRTTILVQYLDTHPAECRVLFYESKKARDPTINEPSPGSKSKIWGNIAETVFQNDVEYGTAYTEDRNKFLNAVTNRLTYLKTKYKKYRASFRQTGAGINPLDASGAKNLKEQVLMEFPWYDVLDGLWKDHPAFAPTTISSAPGVDHASGLMALTLGKGKGKDPQPVSPSAEPLDVTEDDVPDLGPAIQGKGKGKALPLPDPDPDDLLDSTPEPTAARTLITPSIEPPTAVHPSGHAVADDDAMDEQLWEEFGEPGRRNV